VSYQAALPTLFAALTSDQRPELQLGSGLVGTRSRNKAAGGRATKAAAWPPAAVLLSQRRHCGSVIVVVGQ